MQLIHTWSAQNISTGEVIVLVHYVYSMYISCEIVSFVICSTDIVPLLNTVFISF